MKTGKINRAIGRETDAEAKLARDARPVKDAPPTDARWVIQADADLSRPELVAALNRADKLIEWMSAYIGRMAPGDYGECYADLNNHGLFMQAHGKLTGKKKRK